jgi:hypothetical protein
MRFAQKPHGISLLCYQFSHILSTARTTIFVPFFREFVKKLAKNSADKNLQTDRDQDHTA